MSKTGARAVACAAVAALGLATSAAARDVHHAPLMERRQGETRGSDSARTIDVRRLPRLPPTVVVAETSTDTIVIAGRIQSNLYSALDSCAANTLPLHARWKLAWSIADVFDYRIDMSRDLRVGDSFRVLVQRLFDPKDGWHTGRVLAISFVLSRDTLTAIYFPAPATASPSEPTAGDYYDAHGRSLRAAFLRAPVEFRRISSGFGMRLHPILRVWRAHKGTDYVASAGTPVRAIGDGTVIFAGQKGGYGNVIDVRHHNGYVTRYGHLSRFASGVHTGTRVSIGKTIAYVGMTGLATAPHLHFEVLVNGVQRDPRVALHDRGSADPVAAGRRTEFDETARSRLALLMLPSAAHTVASR